MEDNKNSSGYLEIILGPMFSGKTTKLIDIYNVCIESNERVLAINYSADKRYHDSMLCTHDQKMIPCIFTEKLSSPNIKQDIDDADIILINEGQFFKDIYDEVERLVEIEKKKVYVCGLDGDFKQQKFGKLLDLIPLCDNVIKLHSACVKCTKPAIYTHRLSTETAQIVIGNDIYVAMCRSCMVSARSNLPTETSAFSCSTLLF